MLCFCSMRFMLIMTYLIHTEGSVSGFLKIFRGGFISKDSRSKMPSPFGENDDDVYPRDKSLQCTCGLLSQNLSDIQLSSSKSSLNSMEAPIPWLVLIYTISPDEKDKLNIPSKFCAGTVINDRVVLTTASCVVPPNTRLFPTDQVGGELNPATIVVLQPTAGSLKINLNDESTFIQLEVEFATYNPYYLYQRLLYKKHDWDIAFIQLKNPLIFDDTSGIVPICIPPKYVPAKDMEGATLISFGWAKQSTKEKATGNETTYYSVKINRMENAYPIRACQALTAREWISERFFCSNGPGFLDSKFIESHGGPMLVQGKVSPYPYVQFGIISWDFNGMTRGKKSIRVSTNLSGFLEMVEDFSETIEAQWCFNDVTHHTELAVPDKQWDGSVVGRKLLEHFDINSLSETEWEGMNADYREYRDDCNCAVDGLTSWKVKLNSKDKHCSGSIINDKIILTTANCVKDKGTPKIQLRNDLQEYNRYFNVSMIIPHKQYNGKSLYNVALVVLSEPIPFDKKLSPVCLPKYDFKMSEDQGSVFLSDKNVPVNILEKKDCSEAWKSGNKENSKLLNEIFCGVAGKADADAITNDFDGNPVTFPMLSLVPNSNSRIQIQVGIVSSLTGNVLKPVSGKEANDVVLAFNDIKPWLSFIDYFSLVVDAAWCKP